MAGLDKLIGIPPVPEPALTAPSLPLYAAGAVITLCGILAANFALPEPDYAWLTDVLMIAGLGFLFSYGARQFGIAPRILDYGFAAFVVILLAGIGAHMISPEQLLPSGADRPDLRLLSGLAWGVTIWAWVLRSDNRVVGTAVPTMAVLGMAATIDVNPPVLVCFGAFILAVIFLLIHQNYLQNRLRAAVKVPDNLPHRLLMAQLFQSGLCALVVLLAGMLVIVPAQLVFSHLSLAQAIRHLASIRPDPGATGASLHFSDDDNLAIGTGDAWSASTEIVMRVTPSDGQPHYWRGLTYDVYTGEGWQSSLEDDYEDISVGDAASNNRLSYPVLPDLTLGDLGRPPENPLLTTAFEVRGDTSQFYYADSPRQIIFDPNNAHSTDGVQLCHDGRLGLKDGSQVRFPYQIVSSLPPDINQPGTAALLRQAGTNYPPVVRSHYLAQSSSALPDDLAFYQQSVTEALQSLPVGRRDPLDETLALRDWVSHRCVYTLTPPRLPDDSDHVHAFLGDSRRGYCDMFASSLAVLCRAAGIPARLAVGFAPGDPDGGSFNLRAEDKHAWTEVYFPGTGWIEFDATAGSATDGTVPTTTFGSKTSWLSRLKLALGGDAKIISFLVFCILAIAAYVVKTELYDPWRTRRKLGFASGGPPLLKPLHDLSHPYGRLSHALTRLGLPRRPAETPTEYAARVLPLLPSIEREWNVTLSSSLVTALTDAYTQALYSDPALPPPRPHPWDSALTEFETAARRVARQRFWHRVTHPTLRPAEQTIKKGTA
ncbi:MAG: transglutaminase TgpA family protein [Janthinobacterium lividum]